MKLIYLMVFLSFGTLLKAQNSLPQILSEIEKNNKTLKAAQQSSTVQKIDAKTGIYPSDIDVNYEYMFGNKASNNQRESELSVSQAFDFPTAYIQKNKIANMKSDQADIQYAVSRQNILLEAKLLCVELVYFNKLKSILTKRRDNADELNKSYQKRLKLGDANIMETNKIALELLNVQTEYRLNEVEINNRMQKLSELNGDVAISFTDTNYADENALLAFEDILLKSLATNPDLKNLEKEKQIASRSVALAKNMYLPKLNIGYKMSISKPDRFHGFTAGVSIPLWENKNTVKRAKAQSVLVDFEIENKRSLERNSMKQLYDKSIALKKSNDEYKSLLSLQNSDQVLQKALSLGQISLLEYLTEIEFLHKSTEYYFQTERDLHLILSELLKTEL